MARIKSVPEALDALAAATADRAEKRRVADEADRNFERAIHDAKLAGASIKALMHTTGLSRNRVYHHTRGVEAVDQPASALAAR